jgi:hypothetical protein
MVQTHLQVSFELVWKIVFAAAAAHATWHEKPYNRRNIKKSSEDSIANPTLSDNGKMKV